MQYPAVRQEEMPNYKSDGWATGWNKALGKGLGPGRVGTTGDIIGPALECLLFLVIWIHMTERLSSASPGYSGANALPLLQSFASRHWSCRQQSCSHQREQIQCGVAKKFRPSPALCWKSQPQPLPDHPRSLHTTQLRDAVHCCTLAKSCWVGWSTANLHQNMTCSPYNLFHSSGSSSDLSKPFLEHKIFARSLDNDFNL